MVNVIWAIVIDEKENCNMGHINPLFKRNQPIRTLFVFYTGNQQTFLVHKKDFFLFHYKQSSSLSSTSSYLFLTENPDIETEHLCIEI